ADRALFQRYAQVRIRARRWIKRNAVVPNLQSGPIRIGFNANADDWLVDAREGVVNQIGPPFLEYQFDLVGNRSGPMSCAAEISEFGKEAVFVASGIVRFENERTGGHSCDPLAHRNLCPDVVGFDEGVAKASHRKDTINGWRRPCDRQALAL